MSFLEMLNYILSMKINASSQDVIITGLLMCHLCLFIAAVKLINLYVVLFYTNANEYFYVNPKLQLLFNSYSHSQKMNNNCLNYLFCCYLFSYFYKTLSIILRAVFKPSLCGNYLQFICNKIISQHSVGFRLTSLTGELHCVI